MKSNKCAICSGTADKAEQQLNGTIRTSSGSTADKHLHKQKIPF